MRRRLATLAAVSMFALALGASPVLAGSRSGHDSHYDVTRYPMVILGALISCGSNTYQVTYGTADVVVGIGPSASDDVPFFETITLRHVWVKNLETDRSYRVVGGTQISGAGEIPDGPFSSYTFVQKIMIAGSHDSADFVGHQTLDGSWSEVDSGTCLKVG